MKNLLAIVIITLLVIEVATAEEESLSKKRPLDDITQNVEVQATTPEADADDGSKRLKVQEPEEEKVEAEAGEMP